MKLSVSLSDDDVALLDEYARTAGLPSRSAAVARAVHLLRTADLEQDYRAAFSEWHASGQRDDWDRVSGDGLGDAPR